MLTSVHSKYGIQAFCNTALFFLTGKWSLNTVVSFPWQILPKIFNSLQYHPLWIWKDWYNSLKAAVFWVLEVCFRIASLVYHKTYTTSYVTKLHKTNKLCYGKLYVHFSNKMRMQVIFNLDVLWSLSLHVHNPTAKEK